MSQEENLSKLHFILSKVLNINIQDITDDTAPGNVEAWDSYNALMLVSELESGFELRFTLEEVVSITKVADIKETLRKYRIDL